MSSKIHSACPDCGAAPGEPCTRGKRKAPISVFHAGRPALLGELITRNLKKAQANPAP
ncbi:MAG TPA: hypothetical protein VFK05_08965 [Polyangiaceae bacterium]|nr:hypothetical protein [Polyangiaceae bacterium]